MQLRSYVTLACALAGLLPATAQGATSTAGHFRVAISNAAATADFSRTSSRARYVVLQNDQRDRLRQLKAANPATKVLLYKDLSGMVERDPAGFVASGVATQEADANPEWYLRNTAGQRFTFSSYDWIYAADIGVRSYQERWAQNVIAQMREEGWDGVFIDDANPTIRYHYDPDKVAKYPTDSQYGAAMRAALATIGPAVRAAGKIAIPNMGAWRDYPEVVNDWLQFVDGGMDEQFTKWGGAVGLGYIDGQQWQNQLDAVKHAERQGKVFLGVTQSANSDPVAACYGWATMLLAAGGHSYFALHGDYTTENWFPEYELAIGEPVAAESTDSNGVHRRVFGNGLVLVNPTTAAQTVNLGGTYSGSGVTSVSSIEMSPRTGLVLVKGDGAGVPAAAASADAPSSAPALAQGSPSPLAATSAKQRAKPKPKPRARHACTCRSPRERRSRKRARSSGRAPRRQAARAQLIGVSGARRIAAGLAR